MKKCVLMPLFSIDGDKSSLGECAYRFADRVAECGAQYWLLPAFGDNYAAAIDLELLRTDGLVTENEIATLKKNKEARERILRNAFSRFGKSDSYAEFEKANKENRADSYELFLLYEFKVQYDVLVSYALSRGVEIVTVMPPDAETVYIK